MRDETCLLAALDVGRIVPRDAQLRLVLQGLDLRVRGRRGPRRPQPCHAFGCVRSHCSTRVRMQIGCEVTGRSASCGAKCNVCSSISFSDWRIPGS
jgi:hypothetical protein